MVVHRLIPTTDNKAANRLNFQAAVVVVVGDGDSKVNLIPPGERGVEGEQRRANTRLAAPQHTVAGFQLAAVAKVLHVDFKTEGTVVGKGQHVSVSNIGCTLTNPVGGDADRWGRIGLGVDGDDRGDQQHRHAQAGEPAPGGHGFHTGRLPFKTLGPTPHSKVQNVAKDEREHDGRIALYVEPGRIKTEFTP